MLNVTLAWLDDVVRAKRPKRLPVVLSRHTVHGYVKRLHRHFGVSRRRELLVRCQALRGRRGNVGIVRR